MNWFSELSVIRDWPPLALPFAVAFEDFLDTLPTDCPSVFSANSHPHDFLRLRLVRFTSLHFAERLQPFVDGLLRGGDVLLRAPAFAAMTFATFAVLPSVITPTE